MEGQISLSNDAISSRLEKIEQLQVKLLKRNFGVILPEKLVITNELPIINYQIWKKDFKTYCQENLMEEWEILSFLKKDILPSHIREFILPLDSTDEVFRMMDSYFGNPYSEIQSIKDHIIGESVLPADDLVGSDYLSLRMRHIQKYLILFVKHAEPYGELTIHDVSKSLMTWIPKCNTSQLMRYKETIVSRSESDNVSLAQSYLNLITDEVALLKPFLTFKLK